MLAIRKLLHAVFGREHQARDPALAASGSEPQPAKWPRDWAIGRGRKCRVRTVAAPGARNRAAYRAGNPASPARDAAFADISHRCGTSSSGAPRIRCCSPAHRRDSAAAAWTVTALRLVGLRAGPRTQAPGLQTEIGG